MINSYEIIITSSTVLTSGIDFPLDTVVSIVMVGAGGCGEHSAMAGLGGSAGELVEFDLGPFSTKYDIEITIGTGAINRAESASYSAGTPTIVDGVVAAPGTTSYNNHSSKWHREKVFKDGIGFESTTDDNSPIYHAYGGECSIFSDGGNANPSGSSIGGFGAGGGFVSNGISIGGNGKVILNWS